MKIISTVFILAIAISIAVFVTNCTHTISPNDKVQGQILINANKLRTFVADSFLIFVKNKNTNSQQLQVQFLKLRQKYKMIEWAIEYLMPTTAQGINGPPLDEIEADENTAFPPEGLQVIESFLFPQFDTSNRKQLIMHTKSLLNNCDRIPIYLTNITFTQSQIADAIRQELFRIITLGISGFDASISLNSIAEVSVALQSMADIFILDKQRLHKDPTLYNELLIKIKNAIAYCNGNTNFDKFDRARFIIEFINPICRKLHTVWKKNQIKYEPDLRLLKVEATTIFDSGAFNASALVPSGEYNFSQAKALLGEDFFYSTFFSQNNKRSCASCHLKEKAFTDGHEKSIALDGSQLLRNTPSLNYAALQHGQFWDMRQANLESQVLHVISNKTEMHGSLNQAALRLNGTKYRKKFKAIYNTDSITIWQIQNVLASYIRSLAVFNSRYDSIMRGNVSFNQEEKLGFNLFMGKAKCGTCHFMPLFNGTVPPHFSKTESEVLGVPADKNHSKIDADSGRYVQNKMPQLLRSFKTPSLRNIAITTPYMHNGVYHSLHQVMNFYNEGGGVGLGFNVENQTLPSDKLNLTKDEINAIIAFMSTLTDAEVKAQKE